MITPFFNHTRTDRCTLEVHKHIRSVSLSRGHGKRRHRRCASPRPNPSPILELASFVSSAAIAPSSPKSVTGERRWPEQRRTSPRNRMEASILPPPEVTHAAMRTASGRAASTTWSEARAQLPPLPLWIPMLHLCLWSV